MDKSSSTMPPNVAAKRFNARSAVRIKEKLQELNEEFELLNAEASNLEQRIAENLIAIMEAGS